MESRSARLSRIRGRFRSEKPAERKALWREVADGLHLAGRVPILARW